MIKKIKRVFINFLKSFYSVDKYFYLKKSSKFRKFSDEFVLIYTMGKVASTSVFKTINRAYNNKDVFHVHRLNDYYLNQREKMIKKEVFGNANYPRHLVTDLLWKSLWLKAIIKKNDLEKIKLITLIREPVSRNISLFFQWIDFTETIDTYNFKSRNKNYPFDVTTPKNDLSKLYDIFLNKFIVDSHLEWLNTELKSVLNIDILESSFDKQKGYSIIKKNNIEGLVIKLETMNDCFNDAMLDFFGTELDLITANVAVNKEVNKAYVDFKKNINLPKKYIDELYDSSYMRHFYSEEEIEVYRTKWTKNVIK